MDARVLEFVLEIKRGQVDKSESKTDAPKPVHIGTHGPEEA